MKCTNFKRYSDSLIASRSNNAWNFSSMCSICDFYYICDFDEFSKKILLQLTKKEKSKINIYSFNLMDVILRWCSQLPFCNSSRETLGHIISQHILENVFPPEAFKGSKCHTWRSAAGSSSSTDPSISSEDSSAGSSPRCHD